MTEPRFHARAEPIDIDRLVALTGAGVREPRRAVAITGVGSLDWAGPSEIACVRGASDLDALPRCGAGACLLRAEHAARLPATVLGLIVDEPAEAFAKVAAELFPGYRERQPLFGPGVAAGALVHPEARLEPDVSIDPGAVIGPGVEIGRGSLIGANAVIGANVRIGRAASIGPSCVVEHALVGDKVALQAGVRLGQGPASALGRVIVQDGVEIGANAVVERGLLRDTVVGERASIGTLARIGADATVARLSVVAAVDDAQAAFDNSTLGADARAL